MYCQTLLTSNTVWGKLWCTMACSFDFLIHNSNKTQQYNYCMYENLLTVFWLLQVSHLLLPLWCYSTALQTLCGFICKVEYMYRVSSKQPSKQPSQGSMKRQEHKFKVLQYISHILIFNNKILEHIRHYQNLLSAGDLVHFQWEQQIC